MVKFKCTICGYVYDESLGIPEKSIPPGTKWESLPGDFACPLCSAPKSLFKPLEGTSSPAHAADAGSGETSNAENSREKKLLDLSAEEISAICSNLAKGCEKQRLHAEMKAFNALADYYKAQTGAAKGKGMSDAAEMLGQDLAARIPSANSAAKTHADRGALRSLVWCEKVSAMMQSLLDRYAKEGEAMLADTSIYVCDICGFIYLGDTPPEICPVCKVPSYRIIKIERR